MPVLIQPFSSHVTNFPGQVSSDIEASALSHTVEQDSKESLTILLPSPLSLHSGSPQCLFVQSAIQ